MQLKVNHFYKTRDGRKAEVVYVNKKLRNNSRVYVLVEGENRLIEYYDTGNYLFQEDTPEDLVSEWKEPVRVKGWFNVYEDENPFMGAVCFHSKEACLEINNSKIIGQIYIDREVEV